MAFAGLDIKVDNKMPFNNIQGPRNRIVMFSQLLKGVEWVGLSDAEADHRSTRRENVDTRDNCGTLKRP
jgi:hypothetical protein